jgi:hypothetical protein
MKTVTTKKQVCEFTNDKFTSVYVNGVLVLKLIALDSKNSGFDSRAKFLVHNYSNELNVSFWNRTARSINQVVEFLSK